MGDLTADRSRLAVALLGRPPRRTLADLTTREVAEAVYGTPTTAQARAVGYALSGRTDLGVARLHALLERRPELDARAVVAELARRLAVTPDATPPVPPARRSGT